MTKKILFITFCFALLITGCTNGKKSPETIEKNNHDNKKMSNIKVVINDRTYTLKLENNNTAKEFISLLPQKYNMSDLNDNEKYVYLNNSLTTNSSNPKHIKKGDVMLFKDDCLVIFYKSFDTNYSYTKIGHIDNLDKLDSGNIMVKFDV
ncbi:MAG: hypothetical protein IJ093_04175 [Bacilli bacterium]|nr:hypothetical protein [Bacilli bacterium]